MVWVVGGLWVTLKVVGVRCHSCSEVYGLGVKLEAGGMNDGLLPALFHRWHMGRLPLLTLVSWLLPCPQLAALVYASF